MATKKIRTLDFLPEIFRTETNAQFLSATLDPLVAQPNLERIQGLIGTPLLPRADAPVQRVVEATRVRNDYQLEPATVFLGEDLTTAEDFLSYPGLIDAVKANGGVTTIPDRLFRQSFASFDPFVNLDMLSNFAQYYWLPDGPLPVPIFVPNIPHTSKFVFTQTDDGYTVTQDGIRLPGVNPRLNLLRGGVYTFEFPAGTESTLPSFLQGSPTLTGLDLQHQNVQTRDLLGVVANGTQTITYQVPAVDAQIQYDFPLSTTVDLISTRLKSVLDGKKLSEIVAIDGVTALNGLRVAFLDGTANNQYYTIGYSGDPADPTVTFYFSGIFATNTRIVVQRGQEFIGREFYMNSLGVLTLIPYISANLDQIYYQNSGMITLGGSIELFVDNASTVIDINTQILGKINYTSANGVVFSNGLKVKFGQNVLPQTYQDQEYYVAGVGTAIELLPVSRITPPRALQTFQFLPWSAGVGWDMTVWDAAYVTGTQPDYITMARNSRDGNVWSRSNFWFHHQVIQATAEYLNDPDYVDRVATISNRARRPIIEFYPDLQLWNSGVCWQGIITAMDSTSIDPLAEYNFSSSIEIDGYSVQSGDTLIFTGVPTQPFTSPWDRYPWASTSYNGSYQGNQTAWRTVYRAELQTISGYTNPVFVLIPQQMLDVGDQVEVQQGMIFGGQDWYIDNNYAWTRAQVKTGINQRILFDVFNQDLQSFGNQSVYNGTNFRGTPLFTYTTGTGVPDSVLGFPIAYSNYGVLGEILFDIDFNTDEFSYISQSNQSQIVQVNTGYVRRNLSCTSSQRLLGYVPAVAESRQYWVYDFATIDARTTDLVFRCDVPVESRAQSTWPPVRVWANGNLLADSAYTVAITTDGVGTEITLLAPPAVPTDLQIWLLSNTASEQAFASMPLNATNNPLNQVLTQATIGDLRRHFVTQMQNSPRAQGNPLAANNSRDLPPQTAWGTQLIVNSGSTTVPSTMFRRSEYNLATALQFNSQSYIDYKARMIELVNSTAFNDYSNQAVLLDLVVDQISQARSAIDSFYWSDMLPSGQAVTVKTYPITVDLPVSVWPIIGLTQQYNPHAASYQAVLIYKTTTAGRVVQLTRDRDYTFSTVSPSVEIITPLLGGETLEIRAYESTAGNYVPNTPTKLGLWPATRPHVAVDTLTLQPTTWIVGHDGSYTRLWGEVVAGQLTDIRDRVLLEFETRIYNNIKLPQDHQAPELASIMPGYSRQTLWTLDEINEIYSTQFLNWCGINKLDYQTQIYSANNAWTYNYSRTSNKLQDLETNIVNTAIPRGYWRGAYSWFYDSFDPGNKPWELIGYTDEPVWWTARYGSRPYTSTNTTLWADLAQGLDWNAGAPRILPQYRRPQLLEILPVDSAGQTLPPFDSLVGNYSSKFFRNPWQVGDIGPAEFAYQRSSTWPFDFVRLLSLTQPAKLYSHFIDIDNYQFSREFGMWLWQNRQPLQTSRVPVYGSGQAVTSYINWIIDTVQQTGQQQSTQDMQQTLTAVDVRMVYRIGGFTDYDLLQFYLQNKVAGGSTTSFLVPDESSRLLLYRNQPGEYLKYSGVVIQRTERGFAVYGYSRTSTLFYILPPQRSDQDVVINLGGLSATIATNYKKNAKPVSYGTEFVTVQEVAQFLASYGAFCNSRGFVFDQSVGGQSIDWMQMVREFLYWAATGWNVGSILTVNPAAKQLQITSDLGVVQPLTLAQQNFILNQELIPINNQDLSVLREQTTFIAQPLNPGDVCAYAEFAVSSIEHAVVFDNVTLFGDIIYVSVTGLRQNSLFVRGSKTAEWEGVLDANGFILSFDTITAWDNTRKYTVGDIVRYKNRVFIAQQIVQPAVEFDASSWLEINRNRIQTGMLPNSSTRSAESVRFYDRYRVNLEEDSDILGFGLIGFRPRSYMAQADLPDITQVNVYADMIAQKGTLLSAKNFVNANVQGKALNYTIAENWIIKLGDFGGVLNSNFVEVRLDADLLPGNPGVIAIADSSSIASQVIPLNAVYNQGKPIQTDEFLPITQENYKFQTSGYVQLSDLQLTSFYYSGLINAATTLQNFVVGQFAHVADYYSTWQVFSPQASGLVLVAIRNNNNGTALLEFSSAHNFVQGSAIAVVNFSSSIDGYYLVNNVVNPYQIQVIITLNPAITVVTGQGTVLELARHRVATTKDINLSLARLWTRDLWWIDSYRVQDSWQVLEHQPVYTNQAIALQSSTSTRSAIGDYGIVMNNPATGSILRYSISPPALEQTITVGGDWGAELAGTDQFLAVAQPSTLSIQIYSWNVLDNFDMFTATATVNVSAELTSISRVAFSGDSNWLFVTDTQSNRVAIYAKTQTGTASISYLLAGIITAPLIVAPGNLFGASITANYDGSIIVIGVPNYTPSTVSNIGGVLIYMRQQQTFTSAVNQTTYNLAWSPTTTFVNVFVNNQPAAFVSTIPGTVVLNTAPADGSLVQIQGGDYVLVQAIPSATPLNVGAVFGTSVALNTWGVELAVGSPGEIDSVNNNDGAVYKFTSSGGLVGTVTSESAVSPVTTQFNLWINNIPVNLTAGMTVNQVAQAIDSANIPNVTAQVIANNRLRLGLRNLATAQGAQYPIMVRASEADLAQLNIKLYTETAKIQLPQAQDEANFGQLVAWNAADSLAIAAPTAASTSPTTFDTVDLVNFNNNTQFDNGVTTFIDSKDSTGAIWIYNMLAVPQASIDNPPVLVVSEQIAAPFESINQISLSRVRDFGSTMVFTEQVLASSFGGQSSGVMSFVNSTSTNQQAWRSYREPAAGMVDVSRLQNAQIYDVVSGNRSLSYDIINAQQGRLLGVVLENLDYISSTDPAEYTTNSAYASPIWGADHTGQLWFDTSQTRWLDLSGRDLDYNTQYWSQVYPNSQVKVYTWITSPVPPADYTGPGTPLNIINYTETTTVNNAGESQTEYFFWVRNSNYRSELLNKTLTDTVIELYITNPRTSGIAYIAPITPNTVALYNSELEISDYSVFHLGWKSGTNDDPQHTSYQMINTLVDFLPGLPATTAGLPAGLYDKFIDSFTGVDEFGGAVPNPNLPPLARSGVGFRPSQTMFLDRFQALENYITQANTLLLLEPYSEIRNFSFLFEVGPVNPSTGLPMYDVTTLWDYVWWWAPGYDSNTRAEYTVEYYADLSTLGTLPQGTIVQVLDNGHGLREFYRYGSWIRIGLERGTIQFRTTSWSNIGGWDNEFYDSTTWESYPAQAIRLIIRAINEQLFIEDQIDLRNDLLCSMFELMVSQSSLTSNYLPWLNRTSFIDVRHQFRELEPTPYYTSDNTEFLRGWITETKPYHVVIRDFTPVYVTQDVLEIGGQMTDFDLPAQYQPDTGNFVTPELWWGSTFASNQYPITSQIWQDPEYRNWIENWGVKFCATTAANSLGAYVTATQTVIPVTTTWGLPVVGQVDIFVPERQITLNPTPANNTIAVFGDSVSTYRGLTLAPGLDPTVESNYALVITGRIDQIVQRIFPTYNVTLVARGGMTTDEALTGVQNYVGPGLPNPFGASVTILQYLTDNRPNKIVLRYGLADAILMNNATATLTNLQTIIDHAISLGIEVILIGVNPSAPIGDPGNCGYVAGISASSNITAGVINSGIIAKALNQGFKYATPRSLPIPNCGLPDGVHPFDSFGQTIEDEIYNQLKLAYPNTVPSTITIPATVESVTYTSINYMTNELLGVQRAQFGTTAAAHVAGTPVTVIMPGAYVMYGARGYTSVPVITIDYPAVYPAPRQDLELDVVIDNTRVVDVRQIAQAQGYVEKPTITVEPASVLAILAGGSSSTVIVDLDVLQTGDVVTYSSTTPLPGLSSGTRLFVRKISTIPVSLALYRTSSDLANDQNRVPIPAIVQPDAHRLLHSAIIALAPCTAPIRSIQPRIRFDRTSYSTNIRDWAPAEHYCAPYQNTTSTLSSSSLSLASTDPQLSSLLLSSSAASLLIAVTGYTEVTRDQWDSYIWSCVPWSWAAADAPVVLNITCADRDYWNFYPWNAVPWNWIGQDCQVCAEQLSGLEFTFFTPSTNYASAPRLYARAVGPNSLLVFRDAGYRLPVTLQEWQTILPTFAPVFGFTPEPIVRSGTLVRYQGAIYECIVSNSDTTFDGQKWRAIDSRDFNAMDRTWGFYQPTADMPGRNLAELFSGVANPYPVVLGTPISSACDPGAYTWPPDITVTAQQYRATATTTAIIYDGTKFVSVANTADDTIVGASPDLVNFTVQSATTAATAQARAIIYRNGRYVVACASTGTPVIWSENLSSWSAPGQLNAGTNMLAGAHTVGFDNNLWILAGNSVWTSPDLVTWTKKYTPTLAVNSMTTIPGGSGPSVYVGDGGQIFYSLDQTTFIPVTSTTTTRLRSVASNATTTVAVGDGGTITTSTGYVVWTAATSGVTSRLNSVVWNATTGLWVVVGDGGVILTSPDAVTWTARTSGTSLNLLSVAATAGRDFVAGGADGLLIHSGNGTDWFTAGGYIQPQPLYQYTGLPFAAGWGPEESIPGRVSDRLNFHTITRPGTLRPTAQSFIGSPIATAEIVPTVGQTVFSFSGLLLNPVEISLGVIDSATGRGPSLTTADYTIDWLNQTVTLNTALAAGQLLRINANGIGGSNILDTNTSLGQAIAANTTVRLQAQYAVSPGVGTGVTNGATVYTPPVVYKNGVQLQFGVDFTVEPQPGTTQAQLVLATPFVPATDYLVWAVFGETLPVQLQENIARAEEFAGNGSTGPYALTGSTLGANSTSAIVEINGLRIAPALYTIAAGTLTFTALTPGAADIISVTMYNDTTLADYATQSLTGLQAGSINNILTAQIPAISTPNITATTAGTNVITASSTVGMAPGLPVWFSAAPLAEFTASVAAGIMTVTTVTAGAIAIGQTVYGPGIPQNTTVVAGAGTTWTLSTAFTLTPARPLQTSSGFGGLDLGTVYFVDTVITATDFTVSTTAGGPVFAVSTAVGSMAATLSGQPSTRIITVLPHGLQTNDRVQFAGVGGSIQLNGIPWTVRVIDSTTFDVYYDSWSPVFGAVNTPVVGVSSYTGGGTFTNTQSVITIPDIVTDPARLWITVAGERVAAGNILLVPDATAGSTTVLLATAVQPADQVVVTSQTNRPAAAELYYSTTVDQLGVATVRREPQSSQTWLTDDLAELATSAEVYNASSLVATTQISFAAAAPGPSGIITQAVPQIDRQALNTVVVYNATQGFAVAAPNVEVGYPALVPTLLIKPAQIVGNIVGSVLTVASVETGAITVGQTVTGLNVPPGTKIVAQLTATTWTVSIPSLVTRTLISLTSATAGDNIVFTWYTGNTIEVAAELITFKLILDLTVPATPVITNTIQITGRGTNHTIWNPLILANTQVYSKLPNNVLDDIYYNQTWNSRYYDPVQGDPLAVSVTVPAEFLQGL